MAGMGMPLPACLSPAIADTPSDRPPRRQQCPEQLFGIARPALSSHLPFEVIVMGSILLITVSDDVEHIVYIPPIKFIGMRARLFANQASTRLVELCSVYCTDGHVPYRSLTPTGMALAQTGMALAQTGMAL